MSPVVGMEDRYPTIFTCVPGNSNNRRCANGDCAVYSPDTNAGPADTCQAKKDRFISRCTLGAVLGTGATTMALVGACSAASANPAACTVAGHSARGIATAAMLVACERAAERVYGNCNAESCPVD